MASGDVLARWQAADGVPPISAGASLIRRNNHLLMAYDGTTSEKCDFADMLDRKYAGGGVTLIIAWSAASATANDVKWQAEMERHQDDTDDLDADSFGTAVSAVGTAATVSGELQYTSIALTNGAQMDSVAVGEDFRLRITRLPADAADTMAGDAEIKSIEMRET